MVLKKTIWLRDERESNHFDDQRNDDDFVYFGYQKVPQQEKIKRTYRHFETVARRYDFMNTILSFGIHYHWKRIAVEMVKLKPGHRVLDVCGGTGDLSILAHRAVGLTGQVFLFDINRAMIRAGKNKKTHLRVRSQIQYVQGNAEQLSFPDRHFDAVMVGFGIRNVTRMEEGFREMYRVLKPGGKLMCLEFSKPTAPLFRFLYDFYSFEIMPLLGEILAGSRKAYTLLPESIRTFPLPDELAVALKKIGFGRVAFRRLTNGIAVVHLAEKIEVER